MLALVPAGLGGCAAAHLEDDLVYSEVDGVLALVPASWVAALLRTWRPGSVTV